ncbi:MAG: TonB-dependent receptor [Bryobacterales bacterium]|nr:TonB-dependent receptor [Bryobacterales bacterium]
MKQIFPFAILLSVACVPLSGQSGLGSITGTVIDQTDSAIPNATIKIIQLSTNTERVTATNELGLFTLPSLVASKYTLTITAAGFKTKSVENIELNAFQTLALGRVKLELGGGPSTVVDVTADIAVLATESAVRNETIQSKQVTDMPLQGRNWATLLKIIPGSAPRNVQAINGREASYDGYGDFRVNGKASNQTQVNLDGGSNVDHGSDSKTTVTPSLESIQEVAVLTNNFQAEYGIRAGVVINIVTKSGTNSWHATAWDYLRNEKLNATPWDRAYFGLGNPRYRYNYFGGNLGGPIKKDKVFFFFNHENLKQDSPTISQQVRVPTALERLGDFSQTVNADGTRPTIYLPGTQASGTPQLLPNNIVPRSMVNPLGQALMNIYPEPNLKNETNNNYLNQYSREDKRYLNVGKVDWNINDSMRAYVRFSYDYQRYRDLITWAAGDRLPFVVTGWNRPDKALTGNLTKIFSATLVSETLFNWQKDFVNAPIDILQDSAKVDPAKLGLSGLPLIFPVDAKILPEIAGTGYQDFQFNRFPWYARAPETQIANTWTWTKGSHVIKWGGQFILNKKDEIDNSIYKGSFNFGVNTSSDFDWGYSPANLITGSLSQFRQVSNSARKLSKYQDFHFFLQDTWKVTSTLTLDYGLRFYHIPTEFNTQPAKTLDAVFVPALWDPAKAPRFYVPDPTNTRRLIDPAFPNNPLPMNVTGALLYALVPGSGDPLNGVVPLGGALGKTGVRNPNFLLLSPRGGFAWQFANRTVLRGGFGWSYNRPSITQAVNTYENGLADFVDYRQTSLTTLTSSTVKRLSPRNFGALDESSNHVPTIYDFSMSIQRELPFSMVLDVAYIGNVQRHQTMNFNINQVLPGTAWRNEFIDPRLAGNNFAGPISASNPGPLPGTRAVDSNLMRPFRGMGNLNLITNVANARYHSLQTNLNKRLSRGITVQFSHTYGKLLTETESQGPFYYFWKDYTGFVANNDRNHVVAVNYTYDVPSLAKKMGWKNPVLRQVFDEWGIAHLMNFYTGQPLTPGISMQYANNTQGVANINNMFTGSPDFGPRLMPTANPNTGTGNIARSYNIDPFLLPGIPGDGMGSRNYLWSPGTFSNDINISKNFRIREGMGLELRASMFNPFNQVRRQELNTSHQFKMKGANLSDGYSLFNSPDQLVANLVSRSPNATNAEKFNQYRNGVGHYTLTNVLDMRRIEIGMRFRF